MKLFGAMNRFFMRFRFRSRRMRLASCYCKKLPADADFARVVWKSSRVLHSKPRLRFKMIVCKKRWWCASVSKRKFNWHGKFSRRSSLKSLPQPSGWELAARWKTARQVGGDFYDVMELPNQKLGLFIADVADKGMPAALFMALTRTLVRAAVIETPFSG